MKKELLMLILVLLIGFSLLCAISIRSELSNADIVVVTVDGEEYGRYPLDTNCVVIIQSEYGSNRLVIQGGEACVEEASCPDHICVKTGTATADRSIACLPNRVLIYLESELDA